MGSFRVKCAKGGGDFAADVFGSIGPALEKNYGFTSTQIGALYAVASAPNIFTDIFAGVLIDRWTWNVCGVALSAMMVVGLTLTALTDSFGVMLIGRFIFGLGYEPIMGVQSKAITLWFFDDPVISLSFTYTLMLFSTRLATFSVFNFLPMIASKSVAFAMWVPVFICAFTFATTCAFAAFDVRRRRKYAALTKTADGGPPAEQQHQQSVPPGLPFWKQFWIDVRSFSAAYWVRVSALSPQHKMGHHPLTLCIRICRPHRSCWRGSASLSIRASPHS